MKFTYIFSVLLVQTHPEDTKMFLEMAIKKF